MSQMISVEDVSILFNLNRGKVRSIKEKLFSKIDDDLTGGRFAALDHVSFSVDKGETFGIVGSNGAGKSTLLKIVSGIMKPTSGRVVTQGTIAPMIELGAGFDMELSAIENVYLCGAVLGNSKKFITSHMVEILEFAELWEFRDVPVKYFSSGMLARLAFSVSTIVTPDILIVDEILSVGDYDFRQKSMTRMLDLMNSGSTVVYVSHDLDSVKQLCQRVMWLEGGKIQKLGAAEEICSAYIENVEQRDNAKRLGGA